MEALYSKLYDRYTKLKTKKWSEVEEFNREQEVKFLNHLNAADELIEHLRNENNRLYGQVNDLRSEVASIRSSQHEEYTEYQKLLTEEKQKTKVLLEEVERLQNQQRDGLCYSAKINKAENRKLNASAGAKVGSDTNDGIASRTRRKRSRLSGTEGEVPVSPSFDDQLEHALVVESENLSSKKISSEALLDVHQGKCCGRMINSSGGGVNVTGASNCMFQDLVECLLGMKLSSVTQPDGTSISAFHQSSGYSFSLTWVNISGKEKSEFLYRVLSMGTFERVAPEWMKEALMFSMEMCPIFFERVSRVIKLQH